MRVGITGYKGFLGSHIFNRLKNNKKISLIEGFDLPEGDILNQETIEKFVSDKDVIIHLAALNRAKDFDLMQVNVLGTFSLIQAIKSKKPDCRLIFASSFQVYSKSQEDDIINENFSVKPMTNYGFSKKFCEEMILPKIKDNIIFRISNIYGPGCKPFYNSSVATFVNLAKEGKSINISGEGSQSRDFVFVDDVVDAFESAIFSQENGIFNICSGESISMNQLAFLLKENFPNLEITHIPIKEEIILVKGSFAKATEMLKWQPKICFREGLKKCI